MKNILTSVMMTILLATLVLPEFIFGQEAITTVKIMAPKSTSSLPLLLLAEEDPLPEIDIQVETFINHPQALALLLKGDINLLFTGTSQGWSNYLNGGPLVMVNTGIWGVSYLIGKDASIKTLADLKGKRLALPFPGAPLDFQTRYMLKQQGIDPDNDLEISYSPFGQTVPKLLAGQIDVAPLPEPLATNLVTTKSLLRLLNYQQIWAEVADGDPRSPQVSVFATKAYSAEHADLLKIFVVHWETSTKKVQEHPGDVAHQFAEALGMPATIIEQAIQYTLFWVPSFEENQKRVLAYYELVKTSLPEENAPLAEAFFFQP